MSVALWLAVALAALVAAGLAVVGLTEAVPRLGATVELLTLVVIGLMPPLLLACAAAAAGTAAGGPGTMVDGVCVLANGGSLRPLQLVLYGLALAAAARTAVVAIATLAATRRAELRGTALTGATPRALPGGGTVWVLPASQVAAHCGGVRQPRPVVTTGLLGLLGPAEQEAVLHHENAHARLRHPRILLLGAVIAASYRWFPPARMAWTALRRDLEAAADDEAVAVAGSGPLLTALAKVALAQAEASPAGRRGPAAFADPGDLRYRIRRLRQPRPRRARATLTLGLVGAFLAAGLAVAFCRALHAGPGWTTLLPGLAGFAFLGWRPAGRPIVRPPIVKSLSRLVSAPRLPRW